MPLHSRPTCRLSLRVQRGGRCARVGIGVTAPSYTLHVSTLKEKVETLSNALDVHSRANAPDEAGVLC